MKAILSVLCFLVSLTEVQAASPATAKNTITIGQHGDVCLVIVNKAHVGKFSLQIEDFDRIDWHKTSEAKSLVITIECFYDPVGAQDVLEVTLKAYQGDRVRYERHMFYSPQEVLPKRKEVKPPKPPRKEHALEEREIV